MRVATQIIAAAGSLFTAAILIGLSPFERDEPLLWIAAVGILSWPLSPYVCLAYMSHRFHGVFWIDVVWLVSAVVLTVVSTSLLLLGLYVDTDPQNGILILVLPFYQYVAIGLVSVLQTWLLSRSKKPSDSV